MLLIVLSCGSFRPFSDIDVNAVFVLVVNVDKNGTVRNIILKVEKCNWLFLQEPRIWIIFDQLSILLSSFNNKLTSLNDFSLAIQNNRNQQNTINPFSSENKSTVSFRCRTFFSYFGFRNYQCLLEIIKWVWWFYIFLSLSWVSTLIMFLRKIRKR